jgi:hypothetical protein
MSLTAMDAGGITAMSTGTIGDAACVSALVE